MTGAAASGRRALAAPAKLNLYLEVLGRRADGFHELITVLTTLDLHDDVVLSLRPRRAGLPPGRPDVSLDLRAEPPFRGSLPGGADNLAVRAAAALLAAAGLCDATGVHIELTKRIPAAGGLGGGSSDAAAVLQGLAALLDLPDRAPDLQRLAAGLGSDVPFFLHGGTCLCTGRGEIVEPIDAPRCVDVSLWMPPFGVATPAVYAALVAPPTTGAPSRRMLAGLTAAIAGADERALDALHRNDLEAPAVAVEPRLARILALAGAHLSGSGSTLFAWGRREPPAPDADMPVIECVRTRAGGR